LVKGLARSTNGRFVFVPPNSSVDVYVGEQLQKALQPCITNVHVKWNLGVNVQSAPNRSPPVYLNDRLIVYALTNDKTIPFDHNSSVELQIEPDHHSIGIAKVNQIPNVTDNATIARLAAKALILELQHAKLPSSATKNVKAGSTQARFQGMAATKEEKVEEIPDEQTAKQRIIELSLKYNILSPHTAFVGIEKRTNASNTDMVLREVPIEISADDQQLYRHRPPSMMCFAAPSSAPMGGLYPMAYATSSNSAMPQSSSMSLGKKSANTFRPEPKAYGFSLLEQMSTKNTIMMRKSNKESMPVSSVAFNTQSIDQSKEIWPSTDQDIVRYLINKQKFDGLWNSDNDMIKNLTGKSLSAFQSTNSSINDQILASAIIIIMLETRFAGFSSLWHGVVQKARKRIIDLVKKDSNNFDTLMEDIRKQL
jgi:hypothetical protein